MPSDDRARTLEALAPALEGYRSLVVAAAEEVRGLLAEGAEGPDGRSGRLAAELGPFALGRVDAASLARLLAPAPPLGPEARGVVARALDILEETLGGREAAFTVAVPPGGDLRDGVRDALGWLGRAFGAARAVELARTGGYRAEEHLALLEAWPFRRWSAAERRAAPALVAEVRGEDLRAAGLGDLLDGAVKVVLLVEGAAPPAPLARLVSPGTWVAQATEPEAVGRLAAWPGPGVVALFDAGSAPDVVPFVHNPAAGPLPWDRLAIEGGVSAALDRVEAARKRWKGGGHAEDLAHLLSLATPPAAPAAAGDGVGAPAPRAEPADRLAAWLLARADLGGV